MPRWDWLVKPGKTYSRAFVVRVLVKATVLFVLLNVVYAWVRPLPVIQQITVYNTLVPGRDRLPYADNPTEVYNLSLTGIEGMFAAHEIDVAAKGDDEFRVLLLGDSGIWGWLLDNDETMSACLNAGQHRTADDRLMQVYNLGYPITNVTKDVMLLDYALRYAPDAVVWFTTLEGVYDDDQLAHPVVQDNRERVLDLITRYDITLDTESLPPEPDFLDRTIVGQRRPLADWLRLQFYGIAWGLTGYDHRNPRFFRAPVENFPNSEGIPDRDYIAVGDLRPDYLALDVIAAGVDLASANDIPVLLINEPIFRGQGINSDLRYNDLYPRWIYDAYRTMLGEMATAEGWQYVDLWDYVPPERFTDFPLHFDAEWTCRVADEIAPQIIGLAG